MREYDKENKSFLGSLNKENKDFLLNILKYAGVAAIVVIGGAFAVLTGGKYNLPVKS